MIINTKLFITFLICIGSSEIFTMERAESSHLNKEQLALRQQVIDDAVINMLKARGIQIVAEYKIPDFLKRSPKTAQELAKLTGLQANPLHRLLSMLASHGYFTQDTQERFSLTALSQILTSDAPNSIAEYVKTPNNYWWDTIRDLDYSIKTGKSSFEKNEGKSFWQALQENPQQGARFFKGMGNYSMPENDVFASMINCSKFKTVVDIGGGQGGLIKAIMTRCPTIKGILFDMENVISQVTPMQKLKTVAGDFFKEVPARADAYLLKRVLLDWDNVKSAQILKTIAHAMHDNSKLFIIDGIIHGVNKRDVAKDWDILMQGLFAGKNKTEKDFEEILDQAGLELISIKPTDFGIAIIETKLKK